MIHSSEHLISEHPVIVRRRVIWGDCDPANVVYTPRFSDYVVSARDWFLRIGLNVFDRPGPSQTGLSFPLRALSFDFISFLAADDIFDMKVGVTAISRRTFSLSVQATHEDGRDSFHAACTSICFDLGSRKAVAIPAQMEADLRRHLIPAA